MFRLVKLAVYGLVGYAAYEFVRGMVEGPGGPRQRSQGGERPQGQRRQGGGASRQRAGGEAGRSGLMGGSSSPQGKRVETAEADGGSLTETAGRGVIPQL